MPQRLNQNGRHVRDELGTAGLEKFLMLGFHFRNLDVIELGMAGVQSEKEEN